MDTSGVNWRCVLSKCLWGKKEKKRRENIAPTILASELVHCSLEIKAMPRRFPEMFWFICSLPLLWQRATTTILHYIFRLKSNKFK